jgi:hypothetical protein
MFQTTTQNTSSVSTVSHPPTHHDPRPDLQADSRAWEQVLAVLTEDIEPYSILKSLRFAGAYLENGQIVWRHLDLVMPPDEVYRDFLLVHKDAIMQALAVLEE